MSEYNPPPPKPAFKTYAERKAAEEKIRADNNRKTHQEYKLPPVPPPSKRKQRFDQPRDPVPSAGGIPTRDMQPVQLPLAKRKDNGAFADVLPFKREKKE